MKNQSGFTLIELLLVTAAAGLATTFGVFIWGDSLYFKAVNPSGGAKLHVLQNNAVTTLSNTSGLLSDSDRIEQMVPFQNYLVFRAKNPHGVCKWFLMDKDSHSILQFSNTSGNPTIQDCRFSTEVFTDSQGEADPNNPSQAIMNEMQSFVRTLPVVLSNILFFPAMDAAGMIRLYTFDGNEVKRLVAAQYPAHLTVFQNRVFFTGMDSNGYQRLFFTDGERVVKMSEISVNNHDFDDLDGTCSHSISGQSRFRQNPRFTVHQGALYFVAYDGNTCNNKLYRLKKN